jgi:hypothetical protein
MAFGRELGKIVVQVKGFIKYNHQNFIIALLCGTQKWGEPPKYTVLTGKYILRVGWSSLTEERHSASEVPQSRLESNQTRMFEVDFSKKLTCCFRQSNHRKMLGKKVPRTFSENVFCFCPDNSQENRVKFILYCNFNSESVGK